MKILMVDDEPAILGALGPVLTAQGHTLLTATDATEALGTAEKNAIDLVLLDLGLPDADGTEIIARLKEISGAAIIILSARHLESEKVRALDGFIGPDGGCGGSQRRVAAPPQR